MRSRIEDLGRLYEKIEDLLRHHLFDTSWNENIFVDRYLNSEEKIRDLCDDIEYIKNRLNNCYEIAKGEEDASLSL